jgi:hypothetical protein
VGPVIVLLINFADLPGNKTGIVIGTNVRYPLGESERQTGKCTKQIAARLLNPFERQ